jgi:hypothetical protein
MFSLSRLAQVVYVLALSLALFLLLESNRSQAQFRGTPDIAGMPAIGGLAPGGRIIGLPGPSLMPPLNNMMTDTTGSPLAMMRTGGMGGGMMGMGGGMMGMGGGMMAMMGMGGMMMGGMMGMMGMGGMMMGGMMGMGGMSMMGFAGKGMGGFNGRKAL